jgi:8-oxo-dGTP pyrophosphatase MutT (NUDIX family)
MTENRDKRSYIDQIRDYQPKNEQEVVDQKAMLTYIEQNKDVLNRENLLAHVTSSAIVVNKKKDKVLFAHHNIYNAWGWVGGHNDGDSDLLGVAIKEAKEETGLEKISPVDEDILMLDIIHVTNHIKHGKYVGDHLHLNVTYLLEASEEETPMHRPDEHSAVAWFDIDSVLDMVDEKRMIPVYKKAFAEIKSRRSEV